MPANDECELLALIAHELRSPAAVVAGYLRLLRQQESIPEPSRKMIEEADRSCARLLHLVKELSDLADLTGRAPVSCAPVPVFTLWDEVVKAASSNGKTSATLIFAPDDQRASVKGDAGRLKQAFAALLAAMLRERGAEPPEIHGFVSREGDGPSAVIALGDPGITSRRDVLVDRPEPFDRWRGGTGLSLPIACRIVEACGGRIWSLPQNSRGACALSLPVAAS